VFHFEALPIDDRNLMVVRLHGDVTGPDFVEGLARLLGSGPDVARRDFLYDLRRYTGSIDHVAFRDAAAVYAPYAPDVRARSVIVSPDQGFALLCRVFDLLFPGRTHAHFFLMEEALLSLGAADLAPRLRVA